ncbi:MAG: hypothetical protein AAF223_14915 [Bacteroidota bacterium]
MKHFAHTLFLFTLTLGVFSCSEDDAADGPVIPEGELVARNLQAFDRGNVDNPSDIEISFEAPVQMSDVARFSIFFAQVGDTASVTEQVVSNLTAEQQTLVDNTESAYTIRQ